MRYTWTRDRILVAMGLGASTAGAVVVMACRAPTSTPQHEPMPASCFNEYGCMPESDAALPGAAAPPFEHCAGVLHAADAGGTPLSQVYYAASTPMDAGVVFGTAGAALNPVLTHAVRESKSPNAMPNACCYSWLGGCMGGRPFRAADDAPLLAPIRAREDWSDARLEPSTLGMSPELRQLLGAEWLTAAQHEHASIASFARFSLELLALGAPPSLISAAQRAASDEIEHARAAFRLAGYYLDRPVGPDHAPGFGVFDTSPSLLSFALHTFRDGCIAETTAALCAHEAALRTSDPVVRRVLETIAEDEQRHAELAWAAVAWAVRTNPETIGPALRAALSALPTATTMLEDGELAHYGRIGALAERAVLERAIAYVVRPCALELLA